MCGILEGVDLFAMGRILIFLEFGVQVARHPHKCYFAGYLSPVMWIGKGWWCCN